MVQYEFWSDSRPNNYQLLLWHLKLFIHGSSGLDITPIVLGSAPLHAFAAPVAHPITPDP
jgi:hypothetical protein